MKFVDREYDMACCAQEVGRGVVLVEVGQVAVLYACAARRDHRPRFRTTMEPSRIGSLGDNTMRPHTMDSYCGHLSRAYRKFSFLGGSPAHERSLANRRGRKENHTRLEIAVAPRDLTTTLIICIWTAYWKDVSHIVDLENVAYIPDKAYSLR